MRPFRYCPSCGHELEVDDGEESHCNNCGNTWYRNAAPTAGAAIVVDGRALVTLRGSDPEKGRYDVPGGFLKPDEDPIKGLKRELREELAIEVDVSVRDCVQMVPHRYGPGGDFVLALGFRARLVEGEPKPSDDVAEIRWVTLDELDDVDFAWDHDRRLIRIALTERRGV